MVKENLFLTKSKVCLVFLIFRSGMLFCLVASIACVITIGLHISYLTSVVWLHTFLVAVLLCFILEVFRVMLIGAITQKVFLQAVYLVPVSPNFYYAAGS